MILYLPTYAHIDVILSVPAYLLTCWHNHLPS